MEELTNLTIENAWTIEQYRFFYLSEFCEKLESMSYALVFQA